MAKKAFAISKPIRNYIEAVGYLFTLSVYKNFTKQKI